MLKSLARPFWPVIVHTLTDLLVPVHNYLAGCLFDAVFPEHRHFPHHVTSPRLPIGWSACSPIAARISAQSSLFGPPGSPGTAGVGRSSLKDHIHRPE